MLKELIVVSAFTALVVGCSSGSKQEDQNAFGNTQAEEATAEVLTERQVTVQETSEIPAVRTSSMKADLNRMNERQFVAFGFSEDIAKNIVEYREEKGNFKSVQDLKKVEGMDDNTYNRFKDQLGASQG